MKSMLAAVYYGPEDLRVEQYPIPEIREDELLLRVDAASICATDIRIFRGQHRKYTPGARRIPGHEIIGVIAATGPRVAGLEAGQRVFVAPNVGCGQCRFCRRGANNLCPDYQAFGVTIDGAFAEYMRVTAAAIEQGNVAPLGPEIDAATASLIEPFACVLHGQDCLAIEREDVVLIQGAGPIGLMHLLLAKHRQASRVIVSDCQPDRLCKAAELGADRVVNFKLEDLAKAVVQESGGAGADAVVVAAPAHEAMQEALELAAPGGRINYFAGLPKDRPEIRFNANLVHYKELIVTGSTACSTADCRRAANMVSDGEIDLRPLVGRRYPLSEAREAFREAQGGSGLKVVLEPQPRSSGGSTDEQQTVQR